MVEDCWRCDVYIFRMTWRRETKPNKIPQYTHNGKRQGQEHFIDDQLKYIRSTMLTHLLHQRKAYIFAPNNKYNNNINIKEII